MVMVASRGMVALVGEYRSKVKSSASSTLEPLVMSMRTTLVVSPGENTRVPDASR